MSTKFNIYYATTANGPWELANATPISRDDDGNQYTITGLQRDTLYYVTIVGGYLDEQSSFVPLVTQAIGPKPAGVGGVEAQTTPILITRTFSPDILDEAYLGHQFTITGIA